MDHFATERRKTSLLEIVHTSFERLCANLVEFYNVSQSPFNLMLYNLIFLSPLVYGIDGFWLHVENENTGILNGTEF